MKNLFLIISFLLFVNISFAQTKTTKKILSILKVQDDSWNRGDIEEFMQTYWQNDSLMFIGKSGVTYGWQNTLNNYKKGYPDTAAMGKLDFTLINIKKLMKVKGKWFIIADHSS